jgi:hypothetical protein
VESRWSPQKCEISCVKWVEWAGLLGLQVDLDNILAGLPAKQNPHGLQLESMGEGKVLVPGGRVACLPY